MQPNIAGLQNIVTGIVRADDTLTFQDGANRRSALAGEELAGCAVELAEDMGLHVYRKIPVPRQGGLDHVHPVAEPQPVAVAPAQVPEPVHDYIPQEDQRRKEAPMYRGLLGYFPAALFEVAAHSLASDKKHNPGNVDGPHWARSKSSDHADCIVRHLIDAGERGTTNRRIHLRALAWRALALLQEDCEKDGACPAPRSRFPSK